MTCSVTPTLCLSAVGETTHRWGLLGTPQRLVKLATPAEAESRQPPTRVVRRSGSRLSSVPLPSEAGQSSLKASLVSSAPALLLP